MSHQSTGPLSPEELKALADAPYGEATKVIRKHDPLFGRAPGEKIKWTASFEAKVTGAATVEAASLKEAEALADKLSADEIDWDTPTEWDIESGDVEPERSA